MNSFRSQILGTGSAQPEELLSSKKKRGADADAGLRSVEIPRSETRTVDSRDDGRQRLLDETVEVVHDGKTFEAELINLSSGGAMISASFEPLLWDRVDLKLGEHGTVECAIRWIKGGRIGLEFAHETRIECDVDERNQLLATVIATNFPEVEADRPADGTEGVDDSNGGEREETRAASRHPLIWSGLIHFNHDSAPVRLRNISATGALIESSTPVPEGAELLLDLGDAGSIFATVCWTRGDQSGLNFQSKFDLSRLAKAKPDIAPAKWEQPAYLRQNAQRTSPWDAQWGRKSLVELKEELEGFLRR